jgi:protein-glutamine gamma-glutamyltransferase
VIAFSLPRMFLARTPRAPADVLSPRQLCWLGALLVAVALPQAVHLPVGIAVLGLALVACRFVLLRRDVRRGDARGWHVPSWALALFAVAVALAIRRSYGYFIGREPSIAFLFVLCGIKFLEAHARRDGTLIVCLAAFMLITPFLTSQTMGAAVLAVPGVLILGGALDVLARPAHAAATGNWSASLRRAATLIVQGLPIAAILFFMFPRLAAPLWGLPSDRSARTGLSDTMEPGMFTSLTLSDEVAFRVEFDGISPPPPSQRYWRGPVLSRYDGRVWSVAPLPMLGGTLTANAPKAISYTVTLEPSNQPYLFALDLPSSAPRVAGPTTDGSAAPSLFLGLTRDQQLIARAPITQPLRYSLQSVLRNRYPSASSYDSRINLRLPERNPRTIAFARSLRERTSDDAGYINAVLRHFNSEAFVYTLGPPLYEHEPIDQFLFDTRRGFCEHYASAFVVLLRAAGIPARVVTGYQGGEMNPTGGYMIVRQSDAHAWAEALLNGQWVRFDPTAAVAPSRIERGFASSLGAGEPIPLLARLDGGWIKDLDLVWDAINHGWRNHVVDFNYQRQRALWRDLSFDLFAPWQVVVAVMSAAGLWGAAVLLWLARRRRRKERALVLWEDVCRRLARAGLPRQSHEGPLAFSQRAATRWPQFAIVRAAIGEAYAKLRYGSLAPESRDRAALVATLEHAIGALPSPARLRGAAAG